ncbi:putative Eukaryotic aspartyl protease family protein [Tripterygium wilfordii]|uniref:Putative Eukaryotic aspartyl protease family protein n=1 Tax=Tripterygium wilfordii TaxID=458696 RepID=A0A7J7CMF0_TRIWF|nr:putative Eukaryotic aspartyl protease family protein [Tripterygium wilfordii]
MAAIVNTLPLFFVACAIALSLGFSCAEAESDGFSVELIHCDSPKSPFFNSSETHTERLSKAFARSLRHVNHFSKSLFSTKIPESMVIPDHDTLTFGSTAGLPVSFPKLIFGCGHNNAGTFKERATGIVGLGGGSVSLIPQLGAGVVSTPITSQALYPVFYYLTLEAISVGNKRIENTKPISGEGNIAIDSGTTFTVLPSRLYSEIESEILKNVAAKRVPDPTGTLSLCYQYTPALRYPTLTAHFTNADVKLSPNNVFLLMNDQVVCLALGPTDKVPIFGNIVQIGFLVGYDIQKKTVSFMPIDCSKA